MDMGALGLRSCGVDNRDDIRKLELSIYMYFATLTGESPPGPKKISEYFCAYVCMYRIQINYYAGGEKEITILDREHEKKEETLPGRVITQ